LASQLKDPSWRAALEVEFNKDYFKKIAETIGASGWHILPPKHLIFNALNLCPLPNTKAVLLGQDPYHDIGQANGLSFSVQKGIKIPPSLLNIYRELESDISDFKMVKHGSLEKWAKQGVLLLNATLTVELHKANSHRHIGWNNFTSAVIRELNLYHQNRVIYLLLGKEALKLFNPVNEQNINPMGNTLYMVTAAHPSPLSADKFFGSKVFSKTNILLKNIGKSPIDWTLELE